MNKPMNVGIVGAGAISGIYLENLNHRFAGLNPVAICSAHMKSAEEKAEKYGLEACSFEEILRRDDVDFIVNLTPVTEHYGVIKKALEAGKNVYTEKTICSSVEQAKELCRLADEKGLYLGSAPDTFLGAGMQSARKAIDDGLVGDINSFSISINRRNDYLTATYPFLRVPGAGALRDYEVYYITSLVSLLGPVDKVCAFVRAPYTERINTRPGTKDYGRVIETPNESVITAIVQLESGITGTVHHNSETCHADRAGFALYGREGILTLSNPNFFGGEVNLLRDPRELVRGVQQKPEAFPLEPGNAFTENSRGLGAAEMAQAIQQGRRNRASKELALHVLDVLESIEESGKTGRMTQVRSTCTRPEPFPGLD